MLLYVLLVEIGWLVLVVLVLVGVGEGVER